jgi:hypothetical protein
MACASARAEERAQQKIDPSAGDILCLVEVPAEYSTVTRQVIDTAATTREVEVPAEYSAVKKTVLKTPATTREVEVPTEYRTVTIKKVVTPAREVKTEIPAEYDEGHEAGAQGAGDECVARDSL